MIIFLVYSPSYLTFYWSVEELYLFLFFMVGSVFLLSSCQDQMPGGGSCLATQTGRPQASVWRERPVQFHAVLARRWLLLVCGRQWHAHRRHRRAGTPGLSKRWNMATVTFFPTAVMVMRYNRHSFCVLQQPLLAPWGSWTPWRSEMSEYIRLNWAHSRGTWTELMALYSQAFIHRGFINISLFFIPDKWNIGRKLVRVSPRAGIIAALKGRCVLSRKTFHIISWLKLFC